MIKRIHKKIFDFMKYKQFMKPFVIGLHCMLVIVALANIIMIGDDISIGYYLFTLIWMIIGGHLFLKVWEWIFIFLLQIKGEKKKNIK